MYNLFIHTLKFKKVFAFIKVVYRFFLYKKAELDFLK